MIMLQLGGLRWRSGSTDPREVHPGKEGDWEPEERIREKGEGGGGVDREPE